MAGFLDERISADQLFLNAPRCRTRREATEYYLGNTRFAEPHPQATCTQDEMLHQIYHPYTNGLVLNRQLIVQKDQTVRKSFRTGQSDIKAERRNLEIVRTSTSIPVPRTHSYHRSAEFEHLIMDKMPGKMLESVWPSLSIPERESMADQVTAYVDKLQGLRSPCIDAALAHRAPLPAEVKGIKGVRRREVQKVPGPTKHRWLCAKQKRSSRRPTLRIHTCGLGLEQHHGR